MSMLKAFFEIDSDKTLFENLESGQGRFDIQMEPKRGSLPGIVIELKAIQSEFKDAAARDARLTAEAESALDQIEKNEYTTSLKMRGVENIILYGMAFHGKYVRVQSRSSLSNSKAAASMPISEAIQRGWIS